MEGISVIIPYHNDVDDLKETLDSLYDTMNAEPWEVIVVNDGGRNKLKGYERRNLTHIDNPVNLGVGRSFDLGASVARYDTLFLSGADITHYNGDYVKEMYDTVQSHPHALVCTTMSSYKNPDRKFYGADILFKITEEDLPENSPLRNKGLPHRSILEGKWRPKTDDSTYQLPSLMGAFYGVTRDWYEHIRGFEMHYIWGSLEPYISLKSWLLGGEVLINTDIDVLHKSNRTGFAHKDPVAYVYNRMMISFVVFGPYGIQFMEHLGQNVTVERAAELYMNSTQDLGELRKHIEKCALLSAEDLHKKMVEMSHYHTMKGLKE
jgi:GT2 family glycosyltransferase